MFCKVCNMQQTESKYPFLLVCPAYNDLPRYCMSWQTLHNYDNVMKQNGNKVLSNAAKFISTAT